MKIQSEHYAQLESAIRRVQSEHPAATAQSYLDQGLTVKRFRWDLLWAAVRKGYIKIGEERNRATYDGPGVYLPLYDYANDDHIDTALRRITDTK
jgi:hypothetical protein